MYIYLSANRWQHFGMLLLSPWTELCGPILLCFVAKSKQSKSISSPTEMNKLSLHYCCIIEKDQKWITVPTCFYHFSAIAKPKSIFWCSSKTISLSLVSSQLTCLVSVRATSIWTTQWKWYWWCSIFPKMSKYNAAFCLINKYTAPNTMLSSQSWLCALYGSYIVGFFLYIYI